MTRPAECGIPGRVVLDIWRRSKKVETEYGEPKRVSCDKCCGLGWLPPPADKASPGGLHNAAWPIRCTLCGGKGDISLRSIATHIGEDPGALYRLSELRVRPKTASRLLDKLIAFKTGESVNPGVPARAGIGRACPAGGGNA